MSHHRRVSEAAITTVRFVDQAVVAFGDRAGNVGMFDVLRGRRCWSLGTPDGSPILQVDAPALTSDW